MTINDVNNYSLYDIKRVYRKKQEVIYGEIK